MYIMLFNDDGIDAPGIWALYDEFKAEHDITVCAPHEQCSGFSHAITIRQNVKVKRFQRDGADAYEIFGTPADCALLGLNALAKRKVDLVISGINDGFNAASDVHYSGTMGAACEACMQDIPSLAVSTRGKNYDYAQTLSLTRKVLDIMAKNPVPGCFYSLNVPRGEVKGLKYAPLGGKEAWLNYNKVSGDAEAMEFELNASKRDLTPECDRELLFEGYATYTIVNSDWTYRG